MVAFYYCSDAMRSVLCLAVCIGSYGDQSESGYVLNAIEKGLKIKAALSLFIRK